jgi:hypothetical protein
MMSMQQTIPASVQLYLSADKLVPADTAFTAGTDIPCRKKKVKTNDLGVFLLAFSIWNLKEKGIVDLRLVKKKSFFVFQSTVMVIEKLQELPDAGILESLVLDGIAAKEVELKDLIHGILKEDSPWPHKVIINTVINNTVSLGLGTADEVKNSVKQFFKNLSGNVNFVPECESILPLQPVFDELEEQWNQFGTQSPELRNTLISTCRAGINSRILNNDDNGGD